MLLFKTDLFHLADKLKRLRTEKWQLGSEGVFNAPHRVDAAVTTQAQSP